MRALPKISIVTVVKDNIGGLKMAANVIALQSYKNVEHVIVDGDSTDGTKEWLTKYSPSFPAKKVSEPDGGLYDAMNKGIKLSTGDIVVFLNGGDKFSSESVLGLVAADWSNGGWDWGYGAIRNVTEQGIIVNGYLHAPFKKRRFELGTRFVPHPATFMSRHLLTTLGGFRSEFGVSGDQELLIRASSASEPKVWIEFFSDFALGGVSTTNSGTRFYSRFGHIRRHNGLLLFGSVYADYLWVMGQKGMYLFRSLVSKVIS